MLAKYVTRGMQYEASLKYVRVYNNVLCKMFMSELIL